MKTLSLTVLSLSALTLTACSDAPMTDADMAAQYGYSVEEFQEQKEAAARMNMSIEDHLNMGGSTSSTHVMPNGEVMSNVEMKSHEEAAADMGMTLEEHEAAGHVGH